MSDYKQFLVALLEWGKKGISSLRTKAQRKKVAIKQTVHKKKTKFKQLLTSKDVRASTYAMFTILMDGILFAVGLAYWVPFHWYNIIAFGCLWFILKNQVIGQLTKIISSFTLVKIGK